jgi:hypothetical protein
MTPVLSGFDRSPIYSVVLPLADLSGPLGFAASQMLDMLLLLVFREIACRWPALDYFDFAKDFNISETKKL